MYWLKYFLKPAAWAIYFVVVFEVLFMTSPLALLFYSVYGPVLNFFTAFSATSWLSQFFLPHFSLTSNGLLNALRPAAIALVISGGVLFLWAAVPLYGAKLLGRREVTRGLYRFIRHPQYVALAVAGIGTTILWPRFLVALTAVTMIFLYTVLAGWEEEQCRRRFGGPYEAYCRRTGRFLPLPIERRLARLRPSSPGLRVVAAWGCFVLLLTVTLGVGRALQRFSLSKVAGIYRDSVAVLSPARLESARLERVFQTASDDSRVKEALVRAGGGGVLVYVVPAAWRIPDLPVPAPKEGGRPPPTIAPDRYRVLFNRVRTHHPDARGRSMIERAYGRDPVIVAHVDLRTNTVRSIEEPRVRWRDIPTPVF